MMNMDKMEKIVPSAEEEDQKEESVDEEKEEEQEEEKEEKHDDKDDDVDDDKDDDIDDDKDDEEESRKVKEKKETVPESSDKKIPLPLEAKKKKQSDVLNLNNEVVRMRKEVKRVRALVIRKLTRQMAALKNKKGKETEIERNQRRAARLLEEIYAMKTLKPDIVTKTALQKNLNFEQVCKNPKSTISDRAIARIATHPQFNKKIESIKAAVKAFKVERMKGGKQRGKEKVQNQAERETPQSPDKKNSEKKEKDKKEEVKEITQEENGVVKNTGEETVTVSEREMENATHSAAETQIKSKLESVTPESIKSSDIKDIVRNKPQNKAAEKKANLKPAVAVLPKRAEEDEESDLELSDEEVKEYFDDSTEERFHKQSSQSEESDDDDFFVGKVSKFKKKKKKDIEEKKDKNQDVKKDSIDALKKSDKIQSELDELESRLKSKATSLQSVFCSSLAGTKTGGSGGVSRGRGGDRFRVRGKGGSGVNRDFSEKFKRQEKSTERNLGSKYSKPCPEGRPLQSEEKGFATGGRGRGRGRGDFLRQKDHKGGGSFSHYAPQPALHPSWEASKKRKEQQGQIQAFQGKKIKFDDDD
ncbi:serum response factor-binding protein 1 isoform X2 [Parambassis ranga]|uniref:Serum response factor-binding protein 1 n=1 Tax=Parambassis ranga TaxID=210632 RepID=A0A6P7HV33_9TELE|nr:serum response factor-binding protein 1 isoform X2 [Parambassis ranga]